MFQISTFTTRVIRVTSMRILTPMATGIATSAICEAQVIGDEPGQPTSTTWRLIWNCSAIALAAGPMESSIRPITSPIPTKPMPICKPDLKQSPSFIPSSLEKMMMTIGSITVGPRFEDIPHDFGKHNLTPRGWSGFFVAGLRYQRRIQTACRVPQECRQKILSTFAVVQMRSAPSM